MAISNSIFIALWLVSIVRHTSLRASQGLLVPEHAVALPEAGVVQCFGISFHEGARVDGDVTLVNVIMDSVLEWFGDFE